MPFIYVITNRITHKKYIGKTEKTVEERFIGHQYASMYHNTYFYKAIKKYGIDNFKIDIIEECSSDILDEKEIFYIKKYNTICPNGYNMIEGGTGGNTSNSPNYIEGMKKRDYKGANNPMYGKRGTDNPNYGKIYGNNPKISKSQKQNWDSNVERKNKHLIEQQVVITLCMVKNLRTLYELNMMV